MIVDDDKKNSKEEHRNDIAENNFPMYIIKIWHKNVNHEGDNKKYAADRATDCISKL